MDSRKLDKIVLAAMLCGLGVISVIFGISVYYLTVSIFEIAQALNTPEIAFVRIQVAAPEGI